MSEFSQLKKDLSKVLGHKPKKRRLDNIHSSPESTDGVGTTESQAEETIDAIDSTPPYTTADDAGTARNPTEPPSSSVKPAPTYVLIPSAVVLSTEVDTPLSEHGDSHDQYPGMNTPEDHDSSYPLYPDIYRPPTNLEEDDVSPLASRSSRSYHHPSSALADDYKMLSLPHGSSNGPSKQPRYRNHADDENNSPQNWDGKAIEMESDDENMSIVVSLKLASELSLLKSVLDLYRNFNINLGGTEHFNWRTNLTANSGNLQISCPEPATKAFSRSSIPLFATLQGRPHACAFHVKSNSAVVPSRDVWNS